MRRGGVCTGHEHPRQLGEVLGEVEEEVGLDAGAVPHHKVPHGDAEEVHGTVHVQTAQLAHEKKMMKKNEYNMSTL
jgi:hypothetical protein